MSHKAQPIAVQLDSMKCSPYMLSRFNKVVAEQNNEYELDHCGVSLGEAIGNPDRNKQVSSCLSSSHNHVSELNYEDIFFTEQQKWIISTGMIDTNNSSSIEENTQSRAVM